MPGSIVTSCSCISPYQDAKYGKNKRVHNLGGSSKGNKTIACTVCGSKQTYHEK